MQTYRLITHPPLNLPLEGGEDIFPHLQGEGQGGDGVALNLDYQKRHFSIFRVQKE